MSNGRMALVLGGTGHVGQQVVRMLVHEGVNTSFTYFRQDDVAQSLAEQTGAQPFRANLAEVNGIRDVFSKLDAESIAPDILVHAAVVACRSVLLEVTPEKSDEMYAVNVRSAIDSIQCMVSRLNGREGDVVLTASQAGISKVPASAAFAATQSARLGITHALAQELGPRGVRVNLALLGLLDGGISADIDPGRLDDYRKFSAFSRVGTGAEVARAIVHLALTNRWMTGSILPLTGGL